ncbi:MAG TPA: hypothetical protein VJ949_13375 [Cryomorphaceae bacterium]|nr:hypothetical protein [Cryomorphaceae bacterium]
MSELKDTRRISANFDIRAEALAVNLLKNSADFNENIGIEQLLINPLGDLKRRVTFDVQEVKPRYFEQDTALQIDVNRKGLFDTLPEQLFLRTGVHSDHPKKRTKAIEEQIKEARKFFLPFEQAAYHALIEIEQLEQKYTEKFPEFFDRIWGLQNFKDYLEPRQKTLLCHLLPEAYRAVGDWNLTGLIFEAVLQKPVDMTFSKPQELDIPLADKTSDQMILGDDSVMGDTFVDEFPTLSIIVKGITGAELTDFLPEGKKRILLEELLCGYFIPIDVPYEIKIDVTSDGLGFDLGEMTLGYNMVLT